MNRAPSATGRADAGLQGRDLPLAAQVHRRPGHAGRAGRQARRCSGTACPTVPGGGTVAYVNPTRAPLPRRPRAPRGGRHARRSSSRSAPASCSSSRRRSAPRRSASARRRSSTARSRAGTPNPNLRDPRQPDAWRLSIVSFVVRHGGALPAPQLRRRAAQRSVRHPGARRLLVRRPVRPPPARHRPRRRSPRVRARDRPRLRGHQARLGAGQLQLLHLRAVFEFILDAVHLVARDGWKLLAALPLRSADRAVAPPPGPRRARR